MSRTQQQTKQVSLAAYEHVEPLEALPGWDHVVVWGYDHVARIMPVDPADCPSCLDMIGGTRGCTNHAGCGMDDLDRAFRRVGPVNMPSRTEEEDT